MIDQRRKEGGRPVMRLDEYVEHFRARVLQDALAEATERYWLRRAEQFAAVGTPRADETAQACRNRAAMAVAAFRGGETPDHIVCALCGTPTSPWTCSCGETRIGRSA